MCPVFTRNKNNSVCIFMPCLLVVPLWGSLRAFSFAVSLCFFVGVCGAGLCPFVVVMLYPEGVRGGWLMVTDNIRYDYLESIIK